jgi:serine/threonine protein kinase
MSPEQARAEEVDERTDLFSLGVVMYEMATGTQAFVGASAAVVFDAILNRNPLPAGRLNPSLPYDLDRSIEKSLEKERRFRYQHASELRLDLERVRRDSQSGRTVARVSAAEREAPVHPRSPRRAFWLGLIPGVGALYNGEYQKAVIHVAAFGLISVMLNWVGSSLHGFFELLRIVFIAYMAFDARTVAEKNNRG